MNREKVIYAFFIVLALTLNFGFFVGELHNPSHHNIFELFAALVVSLITTVLKFGDRTHLGALMMATSLVADLQLITASLIWGYATHIGGGVDEAAVASIVSFSGGALMANFVSVILLVVETVMVRR
ncbi:hypothetical protein GCM10011348_24830 [Marinobacterium nitratireducens]|uniref:Uncharacterized protein n=1 Tax=Marinobacterium nitratireducens TaxID=518897 RepID=A0A918DUP7_9GAMM|nr:DUF6394 family protein [Marinobacterium nitratireducens]GGO82754.1 hypothetical protein GCM10011348_24830 [Marinobacterium nitratireducens]